MVVLGWFCDCPALMSLVMGLMVVQVVVSGGSKWFLVILGDSSTMVLWLF